MNQNPFRGRPRTSEIHEGVMRVYKNIANGNIDSYSAIISFMKMADQYGKISNLYKIRNQISSHLKDIAKDVLNLDHVTIEYILIIIIFDLHNSVANSVNPFKITDPYLYFFFI